MAKVKCTLDGELMFPSDYLASVEFKGRDVTLTIILSTSIVGAWPLPLRCLAVGSSSRQRWRGGGRVLTSLAICRLRVTTGSLVG